MIRLAYANHNGRPYSSIGKWLADKGELPLAQANMQNIKAWAKAHPDRVDEMLNANQAMVFFREEALSDDAAGPKGAYGIPLVAERSVAVDPNYVPLGSPLYLATTRPHSTQPMQRVVFAQDTGAAIKGVARTDFFWGSGDAAGELAGRMKQTGRVWILWPRSWGSGGAMKHDVIVCGAGIAGMASALALTRAGVNVAVLAPRRAPTPMQGEQYHPRVYAISEASQALLASLGIWDAMPQERITPVDAMQVNGDRDGQVVLDAWQAAKTHLAWIVESGEIERALFQALTIYGVPWIDDTMQAWQPGQVTTAGGVTLQAQLFIGADGARSPLRSAAAMAHQKKTMAIRDWSRI